MMVYQNNMPGVRALTPIIECAMVTYGRLSLLRGTIETFNATRDARVRLTVVDNGSLADVRRFLEESVKSPDSLILLDDNLGKPYAWNLVANMVMNRSLQKAEPAFLLFLDSDLEFLPGWIDTFIEIWQDHAGSSLGCLSGFVSHPELHDIAEGPRRTYKRLRFPAGCCMLTTPAIYRDVGPFEEDRLIRAVDTNYYRRLKAKGYSVGCVHPKSCILHTGKNQRSWSILNSKPIYRP